MADDGFTFFGTNVPPPTDGKRHPGKGRTKRVKVLSGKTGQFYKTGGYAFNQGDPTPQQHSKYITYLSQANFSNDWICNGSHGNLNFSLDLEAPVWVCGHINYCQTDSGTDKITSAQITVEDAAGNVTGTTWQLNTDQPDFAWAQSPPFMIPAGPCTVSFLVYVASDNVFYLSNFDLLAPDSAPIAIYVYWSCFHIETVIPGGEGNVSQTYTTSVDTVHSTKSTVATELGMSLGATLDDISLGLNASIKNENTSTDSVSLQSSTETTFKESYPNTGPKSFDLMLWNPVLEFRVGNGVIIQDSSETLLATQYHYR